MPLWQSQNLNPGRLAYYACSPHSTPNSETRTETGMPLKRTVAWVGLTIMISYSRDAFFQSKVFMNRVIKKQSGTRKGSVNINQWT